MNKDKNEKSFSRFKSDEDAENFVEKTDLSEYDFSDFKPMDFDFESPKEPSKKSNKI